MQSKYTSHIVYFQVKREIFNAGFQIEVDNDDSVTLNKKVRNAQLAQFNFILGK